MKDAYTLRLTDGEKYPGFFKVQEIYFTVDHSVSQAIRELLYRKKIKTLPKDFHVCPHFLGFFFIGDGGISSRGSLFFYIKSALVRRRRRRYDSLAEKM